MSNSKNINGKLQIAPKVFEDIAARAAIQCYGVVRMSSPKGVTFFSLIVPSCLRHKGVVVSTTTKGLLVDVYVVLEYGTNISVVSKNLSDTVRFQIKQFCDCEIDSVNVHVKGMRRSR